MVEHSAVNRVVVGSSPTRGVITKGPRGFGETPKKEYRRKRNGSMVKRLRHRPFTAVTRVRFPLESFLADKFYFKSVEHIIKYGAVAKW